MTRTAGEATMTTGFKPARIGLRGRRTAAVLAVAIAAVATPVLAEGPIDPRVATASFLDNDVRLEVAGYISPRCTVDQEQETGSFGEVLDPRVGGNTDKTLNLAFSFDCNSPFRVSMTSDNGGLLTAAPAVAPFRNRLDYSAALAMGGKQTTACKSADMRPGTRGRDGCVFRFHNPDGAFGTAEVRLSIKADATPLLAGAYADRLTVRITPLLGGEAR